MTQNRWAFALLGGIILLMAIGIVIKIRRELPVDAEQKPIELLSEPTIRVTDPQRGPVDAPITLVYFADFGCDSCAHTWPVIQTLERDPQFKNKIRFVWKDFLGHQNIHPETVTLHRAARCAATVGKFWEYQAAAFAHSEEIRNNTPVFDKLISEVGLNPNKITSCVELEGIKNLLTSNMREAEQLTITASPTLFIMGSGKRFDGLPSYDILAGTLRAILASKNALHQ